MSTWTIDEVAVETLDGDLNDAALTATGTRGTSPGTLVLMLDQPVLAALLAELRDVDRSRAALSGFSAADTQGEEPRPSRGTFAAAVDGQPARDFTDPRGQVLTDLVSVTAADVSWAATTDPWRTTLLLACDGDDPIDVVLEQPLLTQLIADLADLNAERAVANGWADPDSDDEDEDGGDERKPLVSRLLPGRGPLQAILGSLPQRVQIFIACGFVVLIIVLIAIFS